MTHESINNYFEFFIHLFMCFSTVFKLFQHYITLAR